MTRLFLLALFCAGCCKGLPPSAATLEAKVYACNLRSSSRVDAKYSGDYPLVLQGRAYLEVTTRSAEYHAQVPYEAENPPHAIYVCQPSFKRELACGDKLLSTETELKQSCERVKRVKYTGADLLINCGQLSQKSDTFAELRGEIYSRVIVL